jgi:two-component system, NtrC family, sensor kinase
MQQFLHLKESAPKLNKLLKVFLAVYVLALIGYLFGQFKITFTLLDLGGIAAAIFAFSTAVYLTLKGNRSARFYLVAWTFFISGLIIFVLRMLGILPYNFFTENAIQIGSATEAVLLSIALADRINVLKKEKKNHKLKPCRLLLKMKGSSGSRM